MSIGKMRKEFEDWYLDKYCGGEERLKKCHNDAETYYYTGVQSMWVPWQASRAAIEVDLEPDEPADEGAAYLHQDFVKARIESLGLKVKP